MSSAEQVGCSRAYVRVCVFVCLHAGVAVAQADALLTLLQMSDRKKPFSARLEVLGGRNTPQPRPKVQPLMRRHRRIGLASQLCLRGTCLCTRPLFRHHQGYK